MEKIIALTWIERHTIRYALLAEVDRLNELRESAIKLGAEDASIRAIDSSIKEKLDIIEKMRDKC